MLKGKGFAFAAAGALIGASAWGVFTMFTGWDLWFLIPIVGAAAGCGVMWGASTRTGKSQGLTAAALTLVAVFGVRYAVVGHRMKVGLEQEAIHNMTARIAQDMEKHEGDVYNDAGEFKPAVLAKGRTAWANVSPSDKRAYLEALRASNGESMSPLSVFIGFGLFGMISMALGAGAAFWCANTSLERFLVLRGLATDTDALNVAASMRAAQAAREKARAEGATQPGLGSGAGPTKMRLADDSSQDKRSAA